MHESTRETFAVEMGKLGERATAAGAKDAVGGLGAVTGVVGVHARDEMHRLRIAPLGLPAGRVARPGVADLHGARRHAIDELVGEALERLRRDAQLVSPVPCRVQTGLARVKA